MRRAVAVARRTGWVSGWEGEGEGVCLEKRRKGGQKAEGEGEGGFYYGANGSKEIKEHSLCEKLLRRNIFSVKRGATREGEKETDREKEREKEKERFGTVGKLGNLDESRSCVP